MRKNIFNFTWLLIAVLLVIGMCIKNICEPRVTGTETYIVQNGDTMWSIAEDYVGEGVDMRKYIGLIYQYNNGLTDLIVSGQEITIPILSNARSGHYEELH